MLFRAQEELRVLLKLLLLFTLVPLAELYLLLQIAARTSLTFTFVLVLVTGIVGAMLARRQGLGWRQRLQAELQSGQVPTTPLLDGLMIFVAGALLITPGVLTDVVGFSFLVPPIRARLRERIKASLMRGFESGSFDRQADADGQETLPQDVIIDSYVIERDSETESREDSR